MFNRNATTVFHDFSSFVLTGPSTTSTSIQLQLGGQALAGGKKVASATQCLTDIFTVTEQDTIPVLCGTNSGFHGKTMRFRIF